MKKLAAALVILFSGAVHGAEPDQAPAIMPVMLPVAMPVQAPPAEERPAFDAPATVVLAVGQCQIVNGQMVCQPQARNPQSPGSWYDPFSKTYKNLEVSSRHWGKTGTTGETPLIETYTNGQYRVVDWRSETAPAAPVQAPQAFAAASGPENCVNCGCSQSASYAGVQAAPVASGRPRLFARLFSADRPRLFSGRLFGGLGCCGGK